MFTFRKIFRNYNYFRCFRRLRHAWIKPEGFDTGIKVYSCITKDKQPLILKNKGLVTWYTCGPTVYDSSHIGHASCYVKLDIIQKILRNYFNFNLITVMNITDVDDKIIARGKEENVPLEQLTKKYEKEFFHELSLLGVDLPNIVLRVTENMEIIKSFIRKLLDNGKAYKSSDNSVYFDVKSYERYGKLHKVTEENQETSQHKKSPMDFALWKANKPDEIFWDSSWGPGRPGWHIECSALASHIFASNIDVHAGGADLRFPHHENEETQSCAYHSSNQWVNYWLHTGHLHLKDSEKMSKSLKNTILISELLENTTPEVFRLASTMSHYRSSMEFSAEFMETARALLDNYKNCLEICDGYIKGTIKGQIGDELFKIVQDSSDKIHQAILDDFNTPEVIKVLNSLVSVVNKMLHSSSQDSSSNQLAATVAASNLIKNTLHLFGINLNKSSVSVSDDKFVEVMNILNSFRQDVRGVGISNKDKNILELCDSVRDDLKACGVSIKDRGKVSSWS